MSLNHFLFSVYKLRFSKIYEHFAIKKSFILVLTWNYVDIPLNVNRRTYRVSQKTWEFSDELYIVFSRGYFMKRVKDCKDVPIMSPQGTMNTDKFTLFAYCNFLVLLSTTVCSQNINKQNVNISDETCRFQLSQ